MHGLVALLIDDSTTATETTTDDDGKTVQRQKTPMPRARKAKVTVEVDDFDENGIIDRDEDEFRNDDDDDDVSSSTAEHSSENNSDSLEEYIEEEKRINAENLKDRGVANERMTKWRRIVSEMKEKGRGLSCKNVDNVISEDRGDSAKVTSDEIKEKNNSSASCALM